MKKSVIALFAVLFCALGIQAQTTTYNITIAGTRITSSNIDHLSQISGVRGGTITYDPVAKVLTLNDADINAFGLSSHGLSISESGVTVKLLGENSIKSDYAGLQVIKTTHVEGPGRLHIDGRQWGVMVREKFTRLYIENGAFVKAKGGELGFAASDLCILAVMGEDTQVYAYGDDGAICDYASIGLEEPLEIVAPEGAKIYDGAVVDVNDDIVKSQWVAIKKRQQPTKAAVWEQKKRGLDGSELSDNFWYILDALTVSNQLVRVEKEDPRYSVFSHGGKNLLAWWSGEFPCLTVYPGVSSADGINYELSPEDHQAMRTLYEGEDPLEEYKSVSLRFLCGEPSETKALTFTKRMSYVDEFGRDASMLELAIYFGFLYTEEGERGVFVKDNDKYLLVTTGYYINVFPGVTAADNVNIPLTANMHLSLINMLGFDLYPDCQSLQIKFNVAQPDKTMKVTLPVGVTPLNYFNEVKLVAIMGTVAYGPVKYIPSYGGTSVSDYNGKLLFVVNPEQDITVPEGVTEADDITWNITDEQHTGIIMQIYGSDPIGNYSTVKLHFSQEPIPTDISEMQGTAADDKYHSLDGRTIGQRPEKPGIYIHNGKKIVVK